jgi:hypothetical protein
MKIAMLILLSAFVVGLSAFAEAQDIPGSDVPSKFPIAAPQPTPARKLDLATSFMVLVNPYDGFDGVQGKPMTKTYRTETLFRVGPLRLTSRVIAREPGQMVYYAVRERPRFCIYGVCPTLTVRKEKYTRNYTFKLGGRMYF